MERGCEAVALKCERTAVAGATALQGACGATILKAGLSICAGRARFAGRMTRGKARVLHSWPRL